MESINQRIKRLRLAKMMTQEVLADKTGVTYQSVQEWERESGTAPARKRQKVVASALGVTVTELLTGVTNPVIDLSDLSAKQSIVLHLFAQLFSHQQRELIEELRALVDANRDTQKIMGETPLKEVISNESVRAAFGDVPAPLKMKTRKKRRPPPNLKGDDGEHLGDQDVE